jgi:hypothetical protein
MNLFIYYIFVIMMGYGLDGLGSFSGRGKRIFSSVKSQDRLWGPPSLISNCLPGDLSPGVKRPGVKMTTPLRLVRGQEWRYTSTPPTPPLRHTSSWFSAQRINSRDNFAFLVILLVTILIVQIIHSRKER